MRPYRFSPTWSIRQDRGFDDLKALARHIERVRAGRAITLMPCTLGDRGCTAPEAAVEINALDAEGNPHALIGYAILKDLAGNRAVEALRRALQPQGGRLLALDPDAALGADLGAVA